MNKGRHAAIYVVLIFCYWYVLQLRTWTWLLLDLIQIWL